jgi:hypothetical protein
LRQFLLDERDFDITRRGAKSRSGWSTSRVFCFDGATPDGLDVSRTRRDRFIDPIFLSAVCLALLADR